MIGIAAHFKAEKNMFEDIDLIDRKPSAKLSD